jgi:hypothetical protein
VPGNVKTNKNGNVFQWSTHIFQMHALLTLMFITSINLLLESITL